MATANNEQELLTRFNIGEKNTLAHLDNNLNGNAAQIAQANREARHLYASLLKNPDISGWKLATDPVYARLGNLIYDSEPLEARAALSGIQTGALKTQAALVVGLWHMRNNPGQALENIGQAIAVAIDDPSQTLDHLAFGSMQERARLADIMNIEDSVQRIAAHHEYFTEFLASRTMTLATTLASGNTMAQAKNAGMQALNKAIENSISNGGPGAGGGLVYAFETEALNTAIAANGIVKSGNNVALSQASPFSLGAVAMNTENERDSNHEVNQADHASNNKASLDVRAKMAEEDLLLAGRLVQRYERLANMDIPTAQQNVIQATLPRLEQVYQEALTNFINTHHIPQNQIIETLHQQQILRLDSTVSFSAEAEARLLAQMSQQLNAKGIADQLHADITGGIQLQFSNIGGGVSRAPSAISTESTQPAPQADMGLSP